MAGKNKTQNSLLGALLILLVIVTGCGLVRPSCDNRKVIDASVSVVNTERRMIGFNTDTDGLKFGVVSSGALIEREVTVHYDHNAEVNVLAEGSLASLMSAKPSSFYLPANTSQKVTFTITVPENALPGNYTGKVTFCFTQQ